MVDTSVLDMSQKYVFSPKKKNDESIFYEVEAMSINYSFQFKHSLSVLVQCAMPSTTENVQPKSL
jgi:hypothetical protein